MAPNPVRFLEIGVALTSFGAFFMLLGVILFFDGGLLALGNVGQTLYYTPHSAPLTTLLFL